MTIGEMVTCKNRVVIDSVNYTVSLLPTPFAYFRPFEEVPVPKL